MVVETESALRHQTLSHFVHTFIANYGRESAADRAMRSRYVPRNIKTQLLAAIRDCRNDATGDDSMRISSIADLGLFVDTSCSEIVYYHAITSSVLQWTLSLYVRDDHIKNIVKTVLDDMGHIDDEDIQFILEKYRYNEEQKLAGNASSETGVGRVMSFFKPKKFQPTVSYFSYYTQSAMLKLARSLLQNSAVFLNGDAFNIGPAAPSAHDDWDNESAHLYNDYKRYRKKLDTLSEKESLERVRSVLKRGTTDVRGGAMREPPEEIVTAYDRGMSYDTSSSRSDGDDSDSEETENCFCGEVREDVVVSIPSDESPPRTPEDREVESIMNPSSARRPDDEGGGRSARFPESVSDPTSAMAVVTSEPPDTYLEAFTGGIDTDAPAKSRRGYRFDRKMVCRTEQTIDSMRGSYEDRTVVLGADTRTVAFTQLEVGEELKVLLQQKRSTRASLDEPALELQADRFTRPMSLLPDVRHFTTVQLTRASKCAVTTLPEETRERDCSSVSALNETFGDRMLVYGEAGSESVISIRVLAIPEEVAGAMNRGLMFYKLTTEEWEYYNTRALGNQDVRIMAENAGMYLLTNFMPAFFLKLTKPDLTWCVDTDALEKHTTRINIGSSYFLMDQCKLGPTFYNADASLDRRATTYIENFAKEVSNGLRWILQIYRTTHILQQYDLFNTDLAIGQKMNTAAFGNYTPVKLVTDLSDAPDCQDVPTPVRSTRPFYTRPYGPGLGSTPVGGVGTFTRPRIGTAALSRTMCHLGAENVAVRDPDSVRDAELKELADMIARNRELNKNPPSGLNVSHNTRVSTGGASTVTGDTPVTTRTPPHAPAPIFVTPTHTTSTSATTNAPTFDNSRPFYETGTNGAPEHSPTAMTAINDLLNAGGNQQDGPYSAGMEALNDDFISSFVGGL
ncbi:hypothetical protein J6590_088228 [Homalodisca vitripennis]|nr:hypothetical protein J6590_088228 [Homalodisca vitripennis]